MSEQENNRLVIINRGRGFKYEKEFFVQIQEAILNGYRIAKGETRNDVSMRNFRGSMGRAVLYKEGTEPVVETVKVEAPVVDAPKVEAPVVDTPEVVEVSLDSMTKKADMIKYAESVGVKVPEGMNKPVQIKKFIKEATEK